MRLSHLRLGSSVVMPRHTLLISNPLPAASVRFVKATFAGDKALARLAKHCENAFSCTRGPLRPRRPYSSRSLTATVSAHAAAQVPDSYTFARLRIAPLAGLMESSCSSMMLHNNLRRPHRLSSAHSTALTRVSQHAGPVAVVGSAVVIVFCVWDCARANSN